MLPAGDHSLPLGFAGAQRSYIAHVPHATAATKAAPLLVSLHDVRQTAAGAQAALDLDQTADAEGFIVVYPQGLANSWNAGSCCGAHHEDSVAFVRAVVADISAKRCIDQHRIFATGMSNGGMMAYRLACEASDLFAAVAPVAADIRIQACNPVRPIALIAFNGTADRLVPYRGGVASVAAMRERFACAPTSTVERFGVDRCDHFGACRGDVEVTHCTDQGGGHVWSSALGFRTNSVMWAFLRRFSLPD